MSPAARGLTGILLALLAAPAIGQPPAGEPGEIEYSARLRMPSSLDELGYSRAVHVDPHTGEVFVCDSRKQRIVIFDAQGLFLYQVLGGEIFRAPIDLAVDPQGYILLLARHQGRETLLRLDFDGRPLGEIELSGWPEIIPPRLVSLALSPAGDRLYLVDEANQQLWLADYGTRQSSAIGNITGSVDLAAAAAVPFEEAREYRLGHVDVYGDTVLVAMPNLGSVRLFDLDGNARGKVGIKGTAPCQAGFPVAAALGADGNVVVLDWQRMVFMVWDPRTNRCLGQTSGIGNAPGYVYQPADLALDAEGRIYVSQGFEGRVQVFTGASTAAAGN